jgi:hypothetical protein
MKLVHNIANICILLGAAGLIAGIAVKMLYVSFLCLLPISFLHFANTCLLLGIALYISELVSRAKD